MGNASKSSALILVLFIALSSLTVLTVRPANAQSILPPSVPQFTVQFVNASIGVPATNPYTGENRTQQITNESIQITITNQPNYALLSSPGNYHIYYAVRLKPHFGGNWTVLDTLSYLPSFPGINGDSPSAYYITGLPPQSNSNYTVITFSVTPTTASQISQYDIHLMYEGKADFGSLSAIPYGSQLDFQVEALVGHNSTFWAPDPNPEVPWHPYNATPAPMLPQGSYMPAIAYDNLNSTWSSTQTIQIGDNSTSNVSSPTFIPVVPTFVWLAIIAVSGSMLVFVVVIKFRRFNH